MQRKVGTLHLQISLRGIITLLRFEFLAAELWLLVFWDVMVCLLVDQPETEGSRFFQNVGIYLLRCDGHVVWQIGTNISYESIAFIVRVFYPEDPDNMLL